MMKIELSGEGMCQKCQATNVQLYEIEKVALKFYNIRGFAKSALIKNTLIK